MEVTISAITEACRDLKLYEEREESDNYWEAVFYKKDIDEWMTALKNIMGAVLKPAGEKPSGDDLKITESFGGIMKDQVLFKSDIASGAIIVMFWPWQDEEHVTIKAAVVD